MYAKALVKYKYARKKDVNFNDYWKGEFEKLHVLNIHYDLNEIQEALKRAEAYRRGKLDRKKEQRRIAHAS